MLFEDVWKIMATGQALRKEMPRILHGLLCKVNRAHLHVAGTPCPAWSAQAAGEKKGCSGTTLLPFACWAAQRLLVEEDLICNENVPGIPISLFKTLFDSNCIVDDNNSILVSPLQLGHP